MRPRLIISIVLIGLLFVFAVQNAKTVDIAFLFWHVELSRALLLFIVFTLGGIVGWFLRAAALHYKRTSNHVDAQG